MPLIKSSSKKAISQNIRELHTGDTYARTKAKFGAKKANKQAVAIALDTARRAARKNGGKVKRYQGGGEVPLFLESGLQETPLEAQIDPTSPNERAALRMRNAQRPPLGRGETPGMAMAPLAAIGPAAAARGVAAIPSLAGRIGAAGALTSAGMGAASAFGAHPEEDFNWVDPDKERSARINNFPTLMNNLNREMRLASKARMPSVEKQIDVAKAEYEGLLQQRARDRDAARAMWEETRARKIAEERERKERETSMFDKNPYARPGMALGALGTSGITGFLAGRRLSPGKALAASGLAGAAEGGLSQFVPNAIDSETLPPGSPTQQAAATNLRLSPPSSWWSERFLPAAAAGAASGMIGAHWGAMSRLGKRPRVEHPAPPPPSPVANAVATQSPEAVDDAVSFIARRATPDVRRVSEVPFSNKEWARARKLEHSRRWDEANPAPAPSASAAEAAPSVAARRPRPAGNYHSYRDPITGRWTRRPPEERAEGGRVGYAPGGSIQQIPWAQRASAQRLSFAGGMLNSSVPGRTDKLNLAVPAGSYVIPSSVVSYLGQDNSMAGAGVLDAMFGMGPGGSRMGSRRKFRSPQARFNKRSAKYGFQEGGDVAMEEPTEEVPIIAAGGEYVVPPEVLMEKFGDIDYAHKIMDQFVKEARNKHIKTLKNLPGPER